MKTIEDLKQFYNTTLLNDLNCLEEKRKKIAHKLVFIGIALLCVMGVLFFLLQRYLGMVFGPLVLAIVLYIVILLWVSNILSKNYVKEFKTKIISRIVNFVDKSFSYSMNGHISESIYKASRIFKRQHRKYRSKGLVSGKIGTTQVGLSEINSE